MTLVAQLALQYSEKTAITRACDVCYRVVFKMGGSDITCPLHERVFTWSRAAIVFTLV